VEYFPPHIGGVEALFDNLARKLTERGDEVTVLTSLVPGSKSYEVHERLKIHRVNVPSRHMFAFAFPKAAKLAKEADVIHTTTYVATGTTWLARRLVKKPTVATFHEIWGKLFFEMQNPVAAALNFSLEDVMCRLYRNDTLACPSEATKRAMIAKDMPEQNIHVVPSGINHDVFHTGVRPSVKWDGPTYLCYGRAGMSKGIEYLVEAVPEISRSVPGSKLVLMLSRKDRYSNIVEKVKKMGLTDSVTFLPSRPNQEGVAQVIRSCDAVVMPSLSEGFGLNVVEAQACGVPVVASNTTSLPEVVRGGLLVEPRNPAKLAEAVIKLLKDKALREKLGAEGAKYVKRYSWDNVTKGYLDLYEKALS
jgi:glycosyltransferase involved in cell wall biosynthesis